MIEARFLHALPLFRQLPAHRLERIRTAAQMERFERGATLFREGEPAHFIWIVLEGWVHLVRATEPPAQGAVLFTITPEEALCGISAIGAQTYNLSAVAGNDCRVIRIPGEVFVDALREEPGFAFHALQLCTRRLQHIALQYGAMAEPVTHRIIRAILRLRQQFGTTLPMTHRELAQMSWTTTESAIRTVRALKRRGYVEGTRRQLTIRKPHALEAMLRSRNGRAARGHMTDIIDRRMPRT